MNSTVIYANIWRFVFYFLFQVVILPQSRSRLSDLLIIYIIIISIASIDATHEDTQGADTYYCICIWYVNRRLLQFTGVHASALVFTAYIKVLYSDFWTFWRIQCRWLPTVQKMGLAWFMSFTNLLLLIHSFSIFSVKPFSFVYFFHILWIPSFSFITSMVVIVYCNSSLDPSTDDQPGR